MATTLLLTSTLALFSGPSAAAPAAEGRRAVTTSNPRGGRADESATPPLRLCDSSWAPTALSANVTENNNRWEYGYPDFVNQTKNRVPVQSCSTTAQHSVKVGPFTTQAGSTYDITTALIDSLFSVGDRITTFRAVPVTAAGEAVGYPPLYVHHIHVGRLTDYYDEHWFTTHGDYSVGSDYGIGALSTKGYITYLPDGYCFDVDCQLPFAVQAIIQDMRSVASAPNLTIFIQVDFGLALDKKAVQPATLVWNEAPHGPFGYSRFAVLGTQPTMSWWTMKWPVRGVLLPNGKLHSHYARHHRLFLIDDAPSNLGFFGSHVIDVVYVHDSIPPTSGHETMLLKNLSYTEQALSRLPNILCQDNGSEPSFIVAATKEHPKASLWARRRDFLCTSHTLDEGRISTFVQLYRAVSEPEVSLYPMHTNTWFYLDVDGASSSSDIKTVSYRYATYRSPQQLAEPFQDVAFGSCQGKPALSAVDSYVSNNAVGLSKAVSAHHARLANEAEGRSVGMVSAYAAGTACVLLLGALRVRAVRVRASPAHTLL